MKTKISIKKLQEKLPFINRAVSPKSQLPVLLNILLEAKKNNLRIASTDLEIGIEVDIDAATEEEGSVTIPARTFIDLIGSLSEEEIVLEEDRETLIIKTKKTKSVLQTIKSEEFPKLYKNKGNKIATLDAVLIKKDFSSIIFASSMDTTRPALSGVLIKKEEEGFLLVATDGYRLSLKHHKIKGSNEEETENIIVPSRVFRELLVLKEDSEEINVYTSKESSQIIFEQGKTILIGRLIEAIYPDYKKIIPTDFSSKIEFDREEMQRAVKICSIFARDSANIIKMSLSKDKIIISSHTPQTGENSVEVDAKLSGEENEIAFNARYLQDILGGVEEEDMIFEMTGPLNPGVFKIKDDNSYLHLIMPVRVQN